jgi:transcriptional regulator with XRE-family HTH domain
MSGTELPQASKEPETPLDGALRDAVAINLTRLRRNAGLTVDTLAETSGVSRDQLLALEAGRATPNLRVLWALADAFEVPFGVLLSGAACATASFHVLRAARSPVVGSAEGGFRTRALSVAGDPREPDVYEVTLDPGWMEAAAAHAADTFEHIVVVRGTLDIEVGGSAATLGSGDAVFFRADRDHTYRNAGATETVLHLTMVYAGDWIDGAPD